MVDSATPSAPSGHGSATSPEQWSIPLHLLEELTVALVQAPTRNARLLAWVDEMIELCQPDSVHWFDGSDAEHQLLFKQLEDSGTFLALDSEKRPGSYWAH